ncbi:MAG: HU family DNA-binding protein [Nitrospiraceae bacterium]
MDERLSASTQFVTIPVRRSSMTKAQIIEKISEQVTTLTKRQAEIVVNTMFNCVRDSLQKGDKTEIRGFGSFRLRARRMKEGRNPKTGATVSVPAKKVPFFKAGKELKDLLNK